MLDAHDLGFKAANDFHEKVMSSHPRSEEIVSTTKNTYKKRADN